MKHFTAQDGTRLCQLGKKMAKKRNPVYLEQQSQEFTVATNEGTVKGKSGDFLAHDPISGHVWPVAASYVAQHYEDF